MAAWRFDNASGKFNASTYTEDNNGYRL